MQEGIVEELFHGGSGSEASVLVQLRTSFPGIGGTVTTHEGVVAAKRTEFNAAYRSSTITYLRHLIAKKLDDYFHRTRVYHFPHIPRPLGSIIDEGSESYLYQWARGRDGFPWEINGRDGEPISFTLTDWAEFTSSFSAAGMQMHSDICDPESASISQNIVHEFPDMTNGQHTLNSIWRRIDFGSKSLPMNYEVLERFLHDNSEALEETLRHDRYEMIRLSVLYLQGELDERGKGRLQEKIGNYRRDSLSHFSSRGLREQESPVHRVGGIEVTL